MDESADAKAGEHSAGAARQRNGRLGKVDVCQVGTTLAYANLAAGLWILVEGELYLPAAWFTPDWAELRQTVGVPTERTFQRKTDLGWQMLERIRAHGLPYDRIVMDAFYGRERQFRADLQAKNQRYAANVPSDPLLKQQFELELLPALSTANVCELLRAVLPIPTLTPELAIRLVILMLVDRARSTRSRRKARTRSRTPN